MQIHRFTVPVNCRMAADIVETDEQQDKQNLYEITAVLTSGITLEVP